jgi:type VI secretion system secreted protein Hcp
VAILATRFTEGIMAESGALWLKSNGNDVKGESTVSSNGRADTIEVLAYEQGVASAREAATGMVTGRRSFTPIKILKRIDKGSPLILKALTKNEKIDGVIKFYRPNPVGDGTTEQFYTVEIKEGNIASIKEYMENTLNLQTANSNCPLEEVTFVFRTIKWTYTNGGITHEDKWAE